MLEGKLLYTDVYYQYGPLSALINKWSLIIWGKRMLSLQIAAALGYACIVFFQFLLWSRFFSNRFAFLVSFVALLLAPFYTGPFWPWSSVYALLFSIIGWLLFTPFLEKNSAWKLLAAGAMVSFTFWTRQPVGILLFISYIMIFVLFYITRYKSFVYTVKSLLLFLVGAVVVCAAFVIWLFRSGNLYDWWFQNIVWMTGHWAFTGIEESVSILEKTKSILYIPLILFPHHWGAGGIVWGLLPVAALVLAGLLFAKVVQKGVFSEGHWILLTLVFGAIVSWHQYYPQSSLNHLYWGGVPLIFVAAYVLLFLHRVWSSKKRIGLSYAKYALLAVMVMLLLILEIIPRMIGGVHRIREYSVTVSKPYIVSGMKVQTQSQADALSALSESITSYVSEHPDTYFITTPSASRANMFVLTFRENNRYFGPVVTGADQSKLMYEHYRHQERMEAFIREYKPLIYAETPIDIEDYEELFHVELDKPIEYMMSNHMYIYAPIKNN